ncbi:MAG: amino acid ABC transporter permease [Gammaproteobacteria bacterium]
MPPAFIIERRAVVWAISFLIVFAALAPFNITLFGLNPWAGRALVAAALSLNVFLVGFLPFRIQMIIAWLELVAVFLLFFYSFNLSYAYIWERIPHLIGLKLNRGFLMGASLTLFICFVSIIASTLLALIAALARLSRNGIAAGISTFYISFFRGTPLLLQILLIYLGLPQLGIVLTPIPSAVIALSLCYGAYMAEIFRAGIQAIATGQSEAARALGLKEGQIMRLVVLPQAIRLIIPPTGNQFIAMLKDSSLVSVLGAWDLMYMARTHGKAEFKYIEMLITAALIYWILSATFEVLQARLEAYYGKSDKR